MRKEIEVKVKVSNIQDIKSRLENIGCIFSEPIKQNDTTFTNFDDADYVKFTCDNNFLRIRETKDNIYFTLKRPQSNELDCVEKEVIINSSEEMRDIIYLLGYHEVVKINKIRTKTNFQDMEICLDEVEGLGSFIEAEKIVDDDADIVQQEIFNFLKTLGVDEKDRVMNGYDTLLYMKKNNGL